MTNTHIVIDKRRHVYRQMEDEIICNLRKTATIIHRGAVDEWISLVRIIHIMSNSLYCKIINCVTPTTLQLIA